MKIAIIEEQTKEEFTKQLLEFLSKGFKVKQTNIAITEDNTQRTTKFDKPKITKIYFAYLEKED